MTSWMLLTKGAELEEKVELFGDSVEPGDQKDEEGKGSQREPNVGTHVEIPATEPFQPCRAGEDQSAEFWKSMRNFPTLWEGYSGAGR